MHAFEITYRVFLSTGRTYTHRILTWAESAEAAIERVNRELRCADFQVEHAEQVSDYEGAHTA